MDIKGTMLVIFLAGFYAVNPITTQQNPISDSCTELMPGDTEIHFVSSPNKKTCTWHLPEVKGNEVLILHLENISMTHDSTCSGHVHLPESDEYICRKRLPYCQVYTSSDAMCNMRELNERALVTFPQCVESKIYAYNSLSRVVTYEERQRNETKSFKLQYRVVSCNSAKESNKGNNCSKNATTHSPSETTEQESTPTISYQMTSRTIMNESPAPDSTTQFVTGTNEDVTLWNPSSFQHKSYIAAIVCLVVMLLAACVALGYFIYRMNKDRGNDVQPIVAVTKPRGNSAYAEIAGKTTVESDPPKSKEMVVNVLYDANA